MKLSTNELVTAKNLAAPAAVVGAFVLGAALFVGHGSVHAASAIDDNSVEALTSLDHAMEAVASRVTPAVVNVAVTSRGGDDEDASDGQQGGQMQNLPPQLQQFFGQMQRPQQQQIEHGVGSGIIISPDGYIVTNNHVVNGATSIKVTLNDRRILNAKVVGVDKLNDLAVLKVNATNLPSIAWGDSAKLHPGQTVLAFGSPFGYFQFSVTRGIVSALDRPNPYADDPRKPGGFIQTDAAINPGHPGGALVDAHGELVGINTFIISSNGSFAGAGFAIPEQIAKATADQIIKMGGVHHGYLGISMNDVTPANAPFFNLSEASGAIVAQVTPDSPASRAGLKSGDVIDQLNGQKLPNGSALQMAIADVPPGTKVQLGILRSGHPQTIDLTVGEYHGNSQAADNDKKDADGTAGHEGKLGLAMSDITPDVRQQLNLPDNVKGVAIRSVRPGSPAEDAGLQPGDVVVQVNRRDVDSASQAVASVRSIPAGQDVLLLVWSNGGESYRVLHPDQG